MVHHQPLVTYQQVDPQDGGDVVQQQQQHQLIETHSVQVDPSHTDVENIIASVQHQQQQDQTADEGTYVASYAGTLPAEQPVWRDAVYVSLLGLKPTTPRNQDMRRTA